jgi:hypothetical protein
MSLHIENGQPNVSYANVLDLMDLHGKLVGVIHAIVPFSEKKNKKSETVLKHVTNFYFSNGFVYTTIGLALGYKEGMGDTQLARVTGLQSLLCMIPGFAPLAMSDLLYKNGIDNTTDKIVENHNTAYFVFRVPVHARAGNLLSCPGQTALMNAVELIEEEIEDEDSKEENTIRMFGAEDE